MIPRIAITRTWSDNDVAQLTFEVCDGVSVFANEAYASLDWGATAAAALRTFGHQIDGGLFNLEAPPNNTTLSAKGCTPSEYTPAAPDGPAAAHWRKRVCAG